MLAPRGRGSSIVSRLKSELRTVRSLLWFRPAVFIAFVMALVLFVSLVDTRVGLPPPEFIEIGSVKDLLRLVAGGMLTVTTVTLSVLTLTFSIAAGQASPRAVPELMADPVTQNALSTFLATFVFALTGLSFLEFGAVEGVGVTALFALAMVLVALAVKYLVQWIHHIADTLKLNRITQRIYDQAHCVLDDYLHRSWEVDHHAPRKPAKGGRGIMSDRAGYVQLIDADKLDRFAENEEVWLELSVKEGDFVHPAVSVMTVWSNKKLDDDLIARLQGSVVVGSERSAEGDPLLGYELLAEIACRALSPGVNDPQSAITCTHYLGALLTYAGTVRPRDYPPTETRCGRVTLKVVTFQDMLKRAVRPVMRDGANCVEVTYAVIDVLAKLADLAAIDYLLEIQAEAESALDHARQRQLLQTDLDTLESRIGSIRADVQRRTS